MLKLPPLAWLRMLRRKLHKKNVRAGLALAGLILLAAIPVYNYSVSKRIDPSVYTPLLNTIARAESNGNYDAYFGNASNTAIRFTEMSVGEVMQWQKDYVSQGSPSSAVGKYQIVRPTLAGLVAELGIDTQARFDKVMQERMAVALLERRGAEAYVQKQLTREEFAANLAKEWAALPKVTGANPHESYYAGDGLNKSGIAIEEVYMALAALESRVSVSISK